MCWTYCPSPFDMQSMLLSRPAPMFRPSSWEPWSLHPHRKYLQEASGAWLPADGRQEAVVVVVPQCLSLHPSPQHSLWVRIHTTTGLFSLISHVISRLPLWNNTIFFRAEGTQPPRLLQCYRQRTQRCSTVLKNDLNRSKTDSGS